ncbi:MAG: helix-turn-helix domain-containing protein [Solirubrobacteraceae bacterium]
MTIGDFEDPFLTVAEVAELLRLNQQTVRNWIDAGSLPAVRVGRRVRIRRSDLDRVLVEGYRGAPATGRMDERPNAADFWGGEPVGDAELQPDGGTSQPPASQHAATQATDQAATRDAGAAETARAAPETDS